MRKLGYILLPFLVVAAGLEYLLYTKLDRFQNPAKKEELNDPSDLLLPSNDITFRSEDGVNLNGWLIQGKPGFPALVMRQEYRLTRPVLLVRPEGLITSL